MTRAPRRTTLPAIRLWSDLHLEMRRQRALLPPLTPPPAGALVLLAGDIAAGVDGIRWAAATFPDHQVGYVLGNHEFYGSNFRTLVDVARAEAAGTNVHLLEGDSWDAAPGVRVLGATLWTDFDLWGPASRLAAMHEGRRLADATQIECEGRLLSPADTRERHLHTVAWLEHELQRASDDGVAAVVLTHHAPHPLGLMPQHRTPSNLLSAAFASDLSHLMDGPTAPVLWAFGHTHWSVDTVVGRTRLWSNQPGYLFRGEGRRFRRSGDHRESDGEH